MILTLNALNVWGTPIADVGKGFCKHCEQFDHLGHYANCPTLIDQRDFIGDLCPWVRT